MSIKISCPNCDRPYTLADSQKGKTIRCKECKETFVGGKPRRARREDEDDSREEKRSPTKKAKKGGMPIWIWLAGGGVLIAAAAVVIVIIVNKGGGGGGGTSADNFKKIVTGMPEEKVVSLLGPPSRSGTPDQILGSNRMRGKGYDEAKIMVWVAGKTSLIVSIIDAKVARVSTSTDTAAPVDDTSPESPLAQKVAKLQTGLKEADVIAILGQPTRTADKDPFFPILNKIVTKQFGPPKILVWELGADKITLHIASDAVLDGGSLITSTGTAPSSNPAFTEANFNKLKDLARGRMREYDVRKIFGAPTKATRTKFLKIGEFRTELTWEADGKLRVIWDDGRVIEADALFAGKKHAITLSK